MEEIKMGQEVVLEGTIKGILHANCSYLLPEDIEDQGLLENVISRNQNWLKSFNHLIMH